MNSKIKGIAYCILWYFSIWSGFLFVCCPLLLPIIVYPKFFLWLMSTAFSLWEMYPVALMNIIFGTKVCLSGDVIDPNETSIILLNHRTRVDWNFMWAAMYYGTNPRKHRLKIILKSPVRHTPSLGWVMQVSGYLYIRRDWEQDKVTMKNHLQYYKDLGHTFQILIFPEGTNLTETTVKCSNKYADKHNLEQYSEVLHPKTRGFVLLSNTMRQNNQLDAIYDVTLAYPDNIPETEPDVFRGIFPDQIHFHIKRYSTDNLPVEETLLKSWLSDRWKEKEERLKDFYKNKKFSSPYSPIYNGDNAIYLAFVFWTILQILMFYWFITSTIFFWWTVLHTSLFVLLSFISEGYQHIVVSIYRFINQSYKRD